MTRRGRVGRWFAETRFGRCLFRAMTTVLVLGAAYAVIGEEVSRQTASITKRVTVIEEVSPYDVVQACIRTRACRDLLEHPAKARPARAKGGDALQPGSTARQQPGSRGEGGWRGGRQAHAPDHQDPPPGPRQPPASPAHPATTRPQANAQAPTGSSAGEELPTTSRASSEDVVEHGTQAAQETVDGVKEEVGRVTGEVGAAAEGAVCGTLAAPNCTR